MYAYMLVDNNRMYWTNGDYSMVLVHTHAINIVSVFFLFSKYNLQLPKRLQWKRVSLSTYSLPIHDFWW